MAAEPAARSSKPGVAGWPGAWASAALGLLGVGATAAFLHWDAIVAAAATWRGSPTYGYGMLVPPVVLWLAWRQRDVLRQTPPRPWPLGLVLVGGAALAATVGQVVSALAIEQLALVALLQAAALTLLGPAAFRPLAFPLFYLYLAVPVGDGLIAPLQELTARFAVGALELVGVPVRLDGLLIRIPSATFHVAEACAGLRFLLAALAVGVLLAYLFFRSWWARLSFIALAVVLPIVGNALRAAGVVLIAHRSGTRPRARLRSSDLWLSVHRPAAGLHGRAGRGARIAATRGVAAAPAACAQAITGLDPGRRRRRRAAHGVARARRAPGRRAVPHWRRCSRLRGSPHPGGRSARQATGDRPRPIRMPSCGRATAGAAARSISTSATTARSARAPRS